MGTGVSGARGGSSNPGGAAKKITDEEAEALKEQYESGFTKTTQKSIEKYISDSDFDGKGHSLSQTMNYLISRGEDLNSVTASEMNRKYGLSLTDAQVKSMQKTNANVDAAMHPIGKDVVLQRGAHAGMLEAFGVKGYASMTEGELTKALVGQTFRNTTVLSTSYDASKNPFLSPKSSKSGGREVVYNMKVGSKTPAVFGAMSQAEVVLGKNVNWRITGVRFTGKTVRPRLGSPTKQIEIDIETY